MSDVKKAVWIKKTGSGRGLMLGIFYPSLEKEGDTGWRNYIAPLNALKDVLEGNKEYIIFNDVNDLKKKDDDGQKRLE